MARKAGSRKGRRRSLLSRAKATVKKVLKKGDGSERKKSAAPPPVRRPAAASPQPRRRAPRREPDIPFDRIEQTYTPTQTSLKAPLRITGADRPRDQELAGGVLDERWKEEDRLTNKSGDPRIGTHGRTYEPGEEKEK